MITESKIIKALYSGYKLKNSDKWKKRGTAMTLIPVLVFLFSAIAVDAGWLPTQFTEAEIDAIANIIYTIVSIAASYLFTATSTKVGFKPSQEAPLVNIDELEQYEQEEELNSTNTNGGILNDSRLRNEVSNITKTDIREKN